MSLLGFDLFLGYSFHISNYTWIFSASRGHFLERLPGNKFGYQTCLGTDLDGKWICVYVLLIAHTNFVGTERSLNIQRYRAHPPFAIIS